MALMRRGALPVFTFFLFLIGFAGFLSADDGAAAGLKSGFYDKFMSANGGAEKIRAVRSMRFVCVRTLANGDSGSYIYLNRFPVYERSVWRGPKNFLLRSGCDGKVRWSYSCTFDGKGVLDMAAMRQMPLFDWTVLDPAACGASFEALAPEIAGGVSYACARASYKDGLVREYWFEADSMRPAKCVDTDASGVKRYFVIDKSRKVDGIWFPQVMSEVDAKGALLERVEVTEVQTNIGLLPDFAAVPSFPYGVETK